ELFFEKILWNTRYFVLLAVVFSILGGIALFFVASIDIYGVISNIIMTYFNGLHPEKFHEEIVSGLIGAVDLYLMAVVMFIFGFGLYELFISEVDIATEESISNILKVHSLDELKDKLGKVIIMVLIVNFFQRVLYTEYNGALDLVYLSGSVLALALALYFLHKGH
ncbi:YqhA family protein, partial [Sulfurovum sp. bin170]|uniref:YqhA family protein n=1 Tax=Sulfurovum sp. bin170 TaxID=2695268 RepID=UPI0013DF0CE0